MAGQAGCVEMYSRLTVALMVW